MSGYGGVLALPLEVTAKTELQLAVALSLSNSGKDCWDMGSSEESFVSVETGLVKKTVNSFPFRLSTFFVTFRRHAVFNAGNVTFVYTRNNNG